MKKIIISASMIVAVAVLVVGATGAFFSDTETSTGNTFTAGAIDLKIDSTATYNGERVASATWEQKDLVPASDKFFNFTDIKPGDSGENTISLHVINNDAWVCAQVSNLTDYENDQTEPEASVDPTDGVNEGELSSTMLWKVWRDDGAGGGVAGDNIQNGTEQTLTSGNPVNGVLALYDSNTGTPLAGDTTAYIGVEWSLPSSSGNETQTDSMTGDISFYVEQSRNNDQFVCRSIEQQEPERLTVGALLSAYSQPQLCDVTVSVTSGADTIQSAINLASSGETVCVPSGTYTEDVNVNKSITLAGAGSSSTTIQGVGLGEAGALVITADNATVEGFNVIGTGVSAIRISGARSGDTVAYNDVVAAAGKSALLMDGGQSNHTISNNLFRGSGSQLVYVNGTASVSVASTNVDFTNNTFGGTATGALLGMEAVGSSVTLNKFSGTTSYTSLESFAGDLLVNQNNFNVVGQMDVKNVDSGTLNAQSNWWGDTNPADNITGLVDFASFEASAFPQN